MEVTLILFLTATILVASHAGEASTTPDQIHPLRPRSGAAGQPILGVNCLSWRLAVETYNLREWKLVPEACEDYVGHYMLGHQYRRDCDAVADAAYEYAMSLKLAGDGKDAWVFDIDETALSDLPYYARSDVAFGAKKYNDTKFTAWLTEGIAPPVPAVLNLYKKLLSLKIKIVFISGSSEKIRDIRISNLKRAGYYTWEKLVLKKETESGTTAVVYKSKKRTELVAAGYRIIGNMGDQWSDLIGSNVGNRTFKVPDPMYYIS